MCLSILSLVDGTVLGGCVMVKEFGLAAVMGYLFTLCEDALL